MERFRQACRLLPPGLRAAAMCCPEGGVVEELRLRGGQPLWLSGPWGEKQNGGPNVTPQDLEAVIDAATGHSRYLAEETLRQGYLTAEGGFRVGLCGFCVMKNGEVGTMRGLSSLAIRIPRQQVGAAGELPEQWIACGMPNLLIVSPPGGGKTTLLRELVRTVSCRGVRVGLVDERGELAAVYRGVPQLDVGPCTDVLEGCPKALALPMLLRTMTPRVLAVDEAAVEEDGVALALGANCGAALLATAHGASLEEVREKPLFRGLLEHKVFTHAVLICQHRGERRYAMEVL